MKTLLVKNSARLRVATLSAVAVSIVASAIPARCADTLLITENSDTSLSVTWNGASIVPTFVSDDDWTITLPADVKFNGESSGPGGPAVVEPGGSSITGPWNNVFTTGSGFTTLVTVQSDATTTSPTGIPFANDVSGQAGFDVAGLPVELTFNDLGDTSNPNGSVPDGGSTCALSLLSLVTLGAARRFKSVSA
jgi:hypothetical protein